MVHSSQYQTCIDHDLSCIANNIMIQLSFHFSHTHHLFHISAASRFTSSQSIVGTIRTAICVLVVCLIFSTKLEI
ncbi:MAG: hypothetical protein WCG25_03200 [bacterium]